MSAPKHPAAARFVGCALGTVFHAGFSVPGLLGSAPMAAEKPAPSAGVEILLQGHAAIESSWPAGSERTFEIAHGGSAYFTIDYHGRAGCKVWIDGHGLCVIGADAGRISYAPPDSDALRWRLLLGQGLPIAAALRGFEVLHASAVVMKDRAFAFAAPSGTGKTALALALRSMGAELLADDVLALTIEGSAVVAHPGIGVVNVHATERPLLSRADDDGSAPRDGKRSLPVPVSRKAARLAGIYFLDRGPTVEAVRIEALQPPDPRWLLGATFVAHLPLAQRQIANLDMCARIARTVPVYRVAIPLHGSAVTLAERISAHAGTLV